MKQVNEIKNQESTTSNQEEWNNIIKALKASAEKNLGYKHKEKKSRDTNILHLSAIQKDSNIMLNTIKDHQKSKLLKKERNKIRLKFTTSTKIKNQQYQICVRRSKKKTPKTTTTTKNKRK